MSIGFKSAAAQYYVRRNILHNNCVFSGLPQLLKAGVSTNQIKFTETPCALQGFKVGNDGFSSTLANFGYGYEVKYKDDTFYTRIDSFGSANIANFSNYVKGLPTVAPLRGPDSFLIRRFVSGSGCTDYSNELLFAKKFIIYSTPPELVICNPNSGGSNSYSFILDSVYNPNSYAWYPNFVNDYIADPSKTGAANVSATRDGNRIFGAYTPSSAITGKARHLWQLLVLVPQCNNGNGLNFTDTFAVVINDNTDSLIFNLQPKDLLVASYDSLLLKASVNKATHHWKWEKAAGYKGLADLNTLNNRNYIAGQTTHAGADSQTWVKAQGSASQANHYRALANNGCKDFKSNWAMVSHRNYDIYMKDFPADTGAEPNIAAYYNYTHSYDIWISDNKNHGQPQNWNMQDGLKVDADTNYIMVKVRNKSNSISAAAQLHLYWTNASTAEVWPKNWTKNNDNRMWNSDSNRYFYEGGKINNAPISIPPIAANDSVKLTFTWPKTSNFADDVPQNVWFQFFKPGTPPIRDYDRFKWVCVLARIQHCDNPPCNADSSDGMSFKETNTNIAHNVIYNNNVVSANMKRIYISPPVTDPFARFDSIKNTCKVRGTKDTIYPARWKFHTLNPTYDRVGEVYLQLDHNLWTLWSQNNFVGNGYTIVQPGIILLNNPDSLQIGPMDIHPGWNGTIGFSYHLKQNSNVSGADTLYGFRFDQFDMSHNENLHEGTVSMGMQGPQSSNYNLNGGGQDFGDMVEEEEEKDSGEKVSEMALATLAMLPNMELTETFAPQAKTSKITEKETLKTGLNLYPNPFTDNLNIALTMQEVKNISIWITDLNGKGVGKVCILKRMQKGTTVLAINTKSMAAGTYIINIEGLEQKRITHKVSLIK